MEENSFSVTFTNVPDENELILPLILMCLDGVRSQMNVISAHTDCFSLKCSAKGDAQERSSKLTSTLPFVHPLLEENHNALMRGAFAMMDVVFMFYATERT